MLCPEVSDFPPPKVKIFQKEDKDLDKLTDFIKLNSFYRSIVLTIPDELHVPTYIEESLLEDTDYYEIKGVSLCELIDTCFIENFVKNGSIYCLSINKNCVVDNCASITPDGILTLHVIYFTYYTLGLEGTKRPHNYYEISLDLKNIKNTEKIKNKLNKLELFDFYISWLPSKEEVCPSTIAKYFSDKDINVAVHSFIVIKPTATISEIPSLKDAETDEIVEWIGMLAVGGDLNPTEGYISTYSPPESDNPIKSSRISILTVKGFITPNIIAHMCNNISDYVSSRELEDYWASVSVQSFENSIWRWSPGCPRMFQSHDSSTTLFATHKNHLLYSIGQIKF